MIGPTGTKTITSIDVHADGEPERNLLGAHLLVRGLAGRERPPPGRHQRSVRAS
jgi:hypothetical protein